MDNIDRESQTWLAEFNRRILAGRPVSAAQLPALEDAYAMVSDRWGPPSAPPAPPSPRAHRPQIILADRL